MKHLESKLQIACVKWFRYQFPNALIFSIPNGGGRNPTEAKILKAEGVLGGIADLQIIANGLTFFIEMKTEKGRQNPNQKAFESKVKSLGFKYFICRSFEEFQRIVNTELKILNAV